MIEVTKTTDSAIIKINHDLVTETLLPQLRKEINELIAEKCTNITFDFDCVELLDSAGIGMLISVQDTLKRHSGSLNLINVSANIFQMLKMMRLNTRLNISQK